MELFDHHCQEELEDTKEVIRIHKSKKDRQHNGQKDKEVLEDTKGVIRIHKSKKDRQHNGQKDKEELEDTKGVIRIRISKKNRQHKDKKTNNTMAKRKSTPKKNKQRSTKHTHKTKNLVTRTPLKTGVELGCFGSVNSSCSIGGTRRVNLITRQTTTHKTVQCALECVMTIAVAILSQYARGTVGYSD